KGKGKGKGPHTPTSGTNAAGKKTGKCLDCGKYGHWKGDPECDHVKSGKTQPFKPRNQANVVHEPEHFRLDSDSEEDEDLREAILNSLRDVSDSGVDTSMEQTCVISSLTAASSNEKGVSQEELLSKAAEATEKTSSSGSLTPRRRWERRKRSEVNATSSPPSTTSPTTASKKEESEVKWKPFRGQLPYDEDEAIKGLRRQEMNEIRRDMGLKSLMTYQNKQMYPNKQIKKEENNEEKVEQKNNEETKIECITKEEIKEESEKDDDDFQDAMEHLPDPDESPKTPDDKNSIKEEDNDVTKVIEDMVDKAIKEKMAEHPPDQVFYKATYWLPANPRTKLRIRGDLDPPLLDSDEEDEGWRNLNLWQNVVPWTPRVMLTDPDYPTPPPPPPYQEEEWTGPRSNPPPPPPGQPAPRMVLRRRWVEQRKWDAWEEKYTTIWREVSDLIPEADIPEEEYENLKKIKQEPMVKQPSAAPSSPVTSTTSTSPKTPPRPYKAPPPGAFDAPKNVAAPFKPPPPRWMLQPPAKAPAKAATTTVPFVPRDIPWQPPKPAAPPTKAPPATASFTPRTVPWQPPPPAGTMTVSWRPPPSPQPSSKNPATMKEEPRTRGKELRFNPYPFPARLQEQVDRRIAFVKKQKEEEEAKKNDIQQDVVIGTPAEDEEQVKDDKTLRIPDTVMKEEEEDEDDENPWSQLAPWAGYQEKDEVQEDELLLPPSIDPATDDNENINEPVENNDDNPGEDHQGAPDENHQEDHEHQDHQQDAPDDQHDDKKDDDHGDEDPEEDPDDHPSEPVQDSDEEDHGENRIIATAKETRLNSSRSKHLIPMNYEALAAEKQEMRRKVDELGTRKLSFGKYRGYELRWVVEYAPGYIDWCTNLPEPSNWMQHFLRDVGVFTEMVDQLEKAKTLDWELYAVNSSAHPVEWTSWTHTDKIR
ncbi:MAG: hypothetical protein GY906_37760, partial [bacterium]|nr:hypothetical protein [bacterium]